MTIRRSNVQRWAFVLLATAAIGQRPTSADEPATLPTTSATRIGAAALDDAWTRARARLTAGDDASASRIAHDALRAEPPAIESRDRLRMLLAVDDRAYFGGQSQRRGMTIFRAIADGSIDSPYRRAATLVLSIEAKDDAAANLDALATLAADSDDELILWAAGIEARALDRNEVGVKAYARLLDKLGGTGPAILHQTFANELDELERYDDALAQRKRSVEIDPEVWNYNGMGNTLNAMARYAEADAAYAEAMRLDPTNEHNVRQRSRNSIMGDQPENGLVLANRAVELAPQDEDAWYWKGRAHGALKQWASAAQAYQKSLELDPARNAAPRLLAEALDADGKSDEATAVREKYHVAP